MSGADASTAKRADLRLETWPVVAKYQPAGRRKASWTTMIRLLLAGRVRGTLANSLHKGTDANKAKRCGEPTRNA